MLDTAKLYDWPRYSENTKIEISNYLRGDSFGHWNLGNIYTDVPTEFAKRLGQKFGVFTNSGTASLHAALICANLEPGAEVIVPSMTFIRAVTPLAHLNLVPVLCDIDANTGNIAAEKIESLVTTKTRAVIVVHMWGIPCDMETISALCKKHGLLLIEDCSHAHGSILANGRAAGSYGDFSFLSLQRKKLLSVGEGGLVMTSNENFLNQLHDVTSPGSFDASKINGEVDFSGLGLNMRMSPFSAVAAKSLLSEWDQIVSDREFMVSELVSILNQRPDIFETPQIPKHVKRLAWYSLKIRTRAPFDIKTKARLWKFGPLGYPTVAEHPFWNKIKNRQFGDLSRPQSRGTYEGQTAYLENRISVQLPSYRRDEWTPQVRGMWEEDLHACLQSNVGYRDAI